MKRHLNILIILIFVLGSCTNTPIQSGVSSTETPIPTKTVLPTHTKTPTPSATLTVMPTIALPQITFTPIPIKDADQTFASPNKQWTAYTFWGGVPQLTVQNKDESVAWVITEGYYPEFYYGYSIIHWTKDSHYLFYNEYYQIEGLSPFYDGAGLYQLDVETGEVKEIVPSFVDRWKRNFPAYTIAPDDTFLIYILAEENGWFLTKYNIADDTQTKYKLDESGGTFLWAANQSYVLFSSCTIKSWEDQSCSIKKFDINTNEISTVMPAAPQILYIDKWLNSQNILLVTPLAEYYKLNLQSGEMTPLPDYAP
jgi:hypothetical protein